MLKVQKGDVYSVKIFSSNNGVVTNNGNGVVTDNDASK